MARYLMTHSLMSSWLYAMKETPFEDMTSGGILGGVHVHAEQGADAAQ